MNYRRALAIGSLLVLVVIAGCEEGEREAGGQLTMERVTDAELAELASRSLDEEPSEPSQLLAQRAIENGSATARSHGSLVEEGQPFAYERRYYTIEETIIDQQPGTAAELRIEVDSNETVPSNETVAYTALSPRDREVLGRLLGGRPAEAQLARGDGILYTEPEWNRSVLFSDKYDAVRYEDETYIIDIEGTESVTVNTWRYTATVVANSSAAYANQLREEYLFTLSGLSTSEAAVVQEAIAGTYSANGTDDEAFQSVLETFLQHDALQERGDEGTWLVRYDGDVYLADLSYRDFDVDGQ